MAPVTRSSIHGRSVSREGSWQIPTEEELLPEQEASRHEVATSAESVEDETAEEDQSDDGSDEDPFDEHQGMFPRTPTLTRLSLTSA
jgi:hypothetical protein